MQKQMSALGPEADLSEHSDADCQIQRRVGDLVYKDSTVMPLFIETYRGTVGPTDCDDLGHMNVQHYFAAVSNGMFGMMSRLGLTPDEIQRRQMSFAVVHAETDFHRELRSGDHAAGVNRTQAWRQVGDFPT